MTTRQKLELELNKPTTIELLFDDPITGQSKYGDYFMYAVNSEGHEYSFFPVAEVHQKLQNLKKGDKAIITKTALQKGNKLVTNYQVQIPSDKQLPAESEVHKEEENNLPAEEIPETCVDRYYDIMLQSYRDALKIQQELNGMIDPTRIAITLFIARTNSK